MNPSTDLVLGVWSPNKIVNAAKRYMQATYAPGELAIAQRALPQSYTSAQVPQQMSGSGDAALIGAVVGGLALLLGLRVAAAWYVGKQIGRPVGGAVAGGLFGAPGLGVLSLFPEKKAALANFRK